MYLPIVIMAGNEVTEFSWLNYMDEIALVMGSIVSNIVNNEVLMTLFCGSLVILGASVFKKIKRASRS